MKDFEQARKTIFKKIDSNVNKVKALKNSAKKQAGGRVNYRGMNDVEKYHLQ